MTKILFENRNALVRAKRKKEIAEHNEYLNAIKKLKEHNNEKSHNEKDILKCAKKNKNCIKTLDSNCP